MHRGINCTITMFLGSSYKQRGNIYKLTKINVMLYPQVETARLMWVYNFSKCHFIRRWESHGHFSWGNYSRELFSWPIGYFICIYPHLTRRGENPLHLIDQLLINVLQKIRSWLEIKNCKSAYHEKFILQVEW